MWAMFSESINRKTIKKATLPGVAVAILREDKDSMGLTDSLLLSSRDKSHSMKQSYVENPRKCVSEWRFGVSRTATFRASP